MPLDMPLFMPATLPLLLSYFARVAVMRICCFYDAVTRSFHFSVAARAAFMMLMLDDAAAAAIIFIFRFCYA